MRTVIMAGGRGTRLSQVYPEIPKPLIPIKRFEQKKPVLEWEIISLRDQGFDDIIITVGYMADKIMSYFGDGSKWGVKIEYFIEEIPLGNAGALFKIPNLDDDFLVLIADVVFDIDFNRFIMAHKNRKALVTIFTHPNSHPYDSGVIIAGKDGRVEQWLTKEDNRPQYYKNRVNAGLHIISPCVLKMNDIDKDMIGKTIEGQTYKIDLDRDILGPLCGSGKMFCYDSSEYVKDMGTPDRLVSVAKDFCVGIVQAKNLKNKQKAIFLDRDGTINKYVGFLRNIEDFELLPGVGEAIQKINSSGYLAIVVTNQPVIARGEVTVEELETIHNKMETLLGNKGAYIDGLYYCPHHPDSGFEGELAELKFDCSCRKPKPGLVLQAARDFNIDLENSWMIGDDEKDILAGKNAGVHTALIGKGAFGQEISGNSLKSIVDIIFNPLS